MYDPTPAPKLTVVSPPSAPSTVVKLSQYIDENGNEFGRTDGTFRYWPDSTIPGMHRIRWARIVAVKDDVAIVPTHGAASTMRDAVIAAHRSDRAMVEVRIVGICE